MKSKFEFYEIVKVISEKKYLKSIKNTEGVVLGKAQNEDTGVWGYGVSMKADNDLVWHVMEEDLESTGKIADSKEFDPVACVKVSVDKETGEGQIINIKSEK